MMAAAAATVSVRWRAATSISATEVWQTPPALFMALHQEFDFSIDVAADDGNAVVDRYLDADRDALRQSWAGERVFANPPYGRELHRWLEKAVIEAQEHGALVVMVLPARTGNAWFHRHVLPHAEIRFIRGRLNFTVGGGGRKNAPFDSMVVIFRPFKIGGGTIAAQPTFPGFSRSA
jgi:phage N-6-adenine-methyltransferase